MKIVLQKLKEFIIGFLWIIIKSLVIIFTVTPYIFGLFYISQYLYKIQVSETLFILSQAGYTLLFLSLVYYLFAIRRRKTKNIIKILDLDFFELKKFISVNILNLKRNFYEFVKNTIELIKALAILFGFLMVAGLIIFAFVSFGWLIASLSATTVIIILLVLILLK